MFFTIIHSHPYLCGLLVLSLLLSMYGFYSLGRHGIPGRKPFMTYGGITGYTLAWCLLMSRSDLKVAQEVLSFLVGVFFWTICGFFIGLAGIKVKERGERSVTDDR